MKLYWRTSERFPIIPSTAGGRASASGGPAWRSGAAGASDPRGPLDSGASPAATGGPPVQTQHHHLLHEAQVDPHALEAGPQGRLQGGGGASGGKADTRCSSDSNLGFICPKKWKLNTCDYWWCFNVSCPLHAGRGSSPVSLKRVVHGNQAPIKTHRLFQYEKLEGVPELGVIMEQAEGESGQDDRLCLPQTLEDVPDPALILPLPSPDRHPQHQRQVRRCYELFLQNQYWQNQRYTFLWSNVNKWNKTWPAATHDSAS